MAAPAQQGSEPPVIKYEELGPDEDLAKPREVDVMAPEEPPDGERQPMGAPWRRMPQRPGGCVVGLLLEFRRTRRKRIARPGVTARRRPGKRNGHGPVEEMSLAKALRQLKERAVGARIRLDPSTPGRTSKSGNT